MRKKVVPKEKIAYVDEKMTYDWKKFYVWYDEDTRRDYASHIKYLTEEEAIAAVPNDYKTIKVFKLGQEKDYIITR